MRFFRKKLRKKLRMVSNLPTLPPVIFKINRALSDEDASARNIAQIISGDQSLSSSVLRIANSAYYSTMGHSVVSIKDGVVKLGLEGVRKLCTTMAIIKEFKGMDKQINLRAFWRHSIAVAHAANKILEISNARNKYGKDEAYTSGLLHDVGILILANYMPDTAKEVWSEANNKDIPIYEAERAILNMDHGEVGKFLLDRWNIPGSIVDAVHFHHHTADSDANVTKLAIVTELAESICGSEEFCEFHLEGGIELRNGIFGELGIDGAKVPEIEERIKEETEKTEQLLMIGGSVGVGV